MNSIQQTDGGFANNFNVAVILPFYKKQEVFKITLQKNHYFFQRNGIEVIIVMDEPSEKNDVLSLIKNYPLINWKIVVNETLHGWRNPGKTINVGIRNASRKYILVMGPDSEMASDIILIMRRMADYYKNCFFNGRVAFVDYEYNPQNKDQKELHYLNYGSIFVEKEFLEAVGGYDESYEQWGGDDDNIRARLQRYGLKKMKLSHCVLLHREPKTDLENQRKKIKSEFTNRDVNELRHSFYPSDYLANGNGINDWGKDFSKIIYDWNNNLYAGELCLSYLKNQKFKKFDVKQDAFEKKYKVIALMPVYNEKQFIRESLIHLEKYCDGIILLDDSSNDGTYDLAQSEKLLLKVQKAERNGFDDLVNRNMLLDLACFFQSEFYFFIDADERFDERYANLYAEIEKAVSNTICFYLVHLWDNETEYRTDLPEASPIRQPGILHRWRMFKNIGRVQITGKRLHFPAIPYRSKWYIAPILIKHYGMMHKSARNNKYGMYKNEDEDLKDRPGKYDYFLDETVKVNPISEIRLTEKLII